MAAGRESMEKDLLDFDLGSETRRICAFIRRTVEKAGAKGVFIGLSGGVDSAVVGALCVRALGREKVTVVMLPSRYTPASDVKDAASLAKAWHVQTRKVDITEIADKIVSSLALESDRVAKANVQARVRMTILYYLSNSSSALVAGTGDKSEVLTGFFSKFGDGGVDFLPIAHLYKTQVRALGRHLGLPDRIVNKPASPALWPGHTAAEELPADYHILDPLLCYLFDLGLGPAEASKKSGLTPRMVREVLAMHEATAHKRVMPPSLESPRSKR